MLLLSVLIMYSGVELTFFSAKYPTLIGQAFNPRVRGIWVCITYTLVWFPLTMCPAIAAFPRLLAFQALPSVSAKLLVHRNDVGLY